MAVKMRGIGLKHLRENDAGMRDLLGDCIPGTAVPDHGETPLPEMEDPAVSTPQRRAMVRALRTELEDTLRLLEEALKKCGT